MDTQQIINLYTQVYRQLYKKTPRDLSLLDNGRVIVNGAQMHISELEYLTRQLQLEYHQQTAARRNVVGRLIGWFSSTRH
jgi:hypothetical protein